MINEGTLNTLNDVNFSEMPRDPFEGDPNDPARLLDEDEPFAPLSEDERAGLHQDLKLVKEFRTHLAPRGIKGIVYFCEDCDRPHYCDWEMMQSNIRATLQDELPPVHEPSANPNPDEYAPWEYCMGFLDGITHHRFGR